MATFDDNGAPIAPAKSANIEIVGHASGVDKNYDFDQWLAAFTTADLAEGANLYYTDEKVDDRVASLIQNGTGISWTYSDGAGTLTPVLSDPSTEDANIRHIAVSEGLINHTAITALNSTPQSICAATPVNGIAQMLALSLEFDNQDTTAYTNNGLEVIESISTAQIATVPSGFLNNGNDTIWMVFGSTPSVKVSPAGTLQLKALVGDPTSGGANNQIKYSLTYRIVDFDAIVS